MVEPKWREILTAAAFQAPQLPPEERSPPVWLLPLPLATRIPMQQRSDLLQQPYKDSHQGFAAILAVVVATLQPTIRYQK